MNDNDYGENALMASIILILAIFGGGILMAILMAIVIWLSSFI